MEPKNEETPQEPPHEPDERLKGGKTSKFFIDDSEFEKPFNKAHDDYHAAVAEERDRIKQALDMPRHPLSEEAVARVKILPENEACKLIEAECAACSNDLHKRMAHNELWVGSIYYYIMKPYPWMKWMNGNSDNTGKKEGS